MIKSISPNFGKNFVTNQKFGLKRLDPFLKVKISYFIPSIFTSKIRPKGKFWQKPQSRYSTSVAKVIHRLFRQFKKLKVIFFIKYTL
jgi:hypothetical protein